MDRLLKELADGHFHSGEALGKALGISRAAVWKKIKSLEELGLSLDSVRGRGYRLGSGIELLDSHAIVSGLERDVLPRVRLHTCLSTTSTNDLVREQGELPPGMIGFCLAEHQSSGRGRRGRSWQSPFGSTISLSLRRQMGEGVASLEGLSLAVGLAALRALEASGARGLQLKWPNDVLWQSKKLSGILLEVHGDPTGDCEVVIGIGINVKLSANQLQNIGQPAVDLHEVIGKSVSRNQVISYLINTLCHMLDGFCNGGFALYCDQWRAHDAYLGQEVVLQASGRSIKGVARGVNEHGSLLLETGSRIQVINGGEVSLRKS